MSTGDIATVTSDNDLRASRRQLLADSAGIGVSAVGFGFVYGLSAARGRLLADRGAWR